MPANAVYGMRRRPAGHGCLRHLSLAGAMSVGGGWRPCVVCFYGSLSEKGKQCPCKPGSVPVKTGACHLSNPQVALRLKRSTLHRVARTGSPLTMVYMNLQPPAGTAPRSPAAWWSLAPPSHPCRTWRRLFSSAVTCRRRQLLLSEVECPVLPGLSSRPRAARFRGDAKSRRQSRNTASRPQR